MGQRPKSAHAHRQMTLCRLQRSMMSHTLQRAPSYRVPTVFLLPTHAVAQTTSNRAQKATGPVSMKLQNWATVIQRMRKRKGSDFAGRRKTSSQIQNALKN